MDTELKQTVYTQKQFKPGLADELLRRLSQLPTEEAAPAHPSKTKMRQEAKRLMEGGIPQLCRECCNSKLGRVRIHPNQGRFFFGRGGLYWICHRCLNPASPKVKICYGHNTAPQ